MRVTICTTFLLLAMFVSSLSFAQQLTIASDVAGAEVFVNSEPAGVIPASTGQVVLSLAPGSYSVNVTAPSFVPPAQTINLVIGQEARLEFLRSSPNVMPSTPVVTPTITPPVTPSTPAVTNTTTTPASSDPRLLGSAIIRGNVPNARVFINGQELGFSDSVGGFFLENVPPGRYDVKITAVGYADQTSGVTVYAGETSELRLELPQYATGSLRILTGLTSGQVYLDDVLLGVIQNGDFRAGDIPIGEHLLRVEAPKFKTFEQTITINRDQTTTYELGQ